MCLLRYYGARVTIWRPRQDRIVDYKLWNNSFVWEADYADFKRRNESEWTRPRAMVNQVNVFLHIRKGFRSQSDANGKSKEA